MRPPFMVTKASVPTCQGKPPLKTPAIFGTSKRFLAGSQTKNVRYSSIQPSNRGIFFIVEIWNGRGGRHDHFSDVYRPFRLFPTFRFLRRRFHFDPSNH